MDSNGKRATRRGETTAHKNSTSPRPMSEKNEGAKPIVMRDVEILLLLLFLRLKRPFECMKKLFSVRQRRLRLRYVKYVRGMGSELIFIGGWWRAEGKYLMWMMFEGRMRMLCHEDYIFFARFGCGITARKSWGFSSAFLFDLLTKIHWNCSTFIDQKLYLNSAPHPTWTLHQLQQRSLSCYDKIIRL